MNIAGIDPGLATGGLVLVKSGRTDREDRVIDAVSLVDKKKDIEADKKYIKSKVGKENWGDRAFTVAILRMNRWVDLCIQEVERMREEHGIDMIGIESFVDQPSRAKKMMQLRWQTPLVIGSLAYRLEELGYTVENGKIYYQNAGVVLKQWEAELALLKRENSRGGKPEGVIVAGDQIITNDHMRKALVHALALSIRMRKNNS